MGLILSSSVFSMFMLTTNKKKAKITIEGSASVCRLLAKAMHPFNIANFELSFVAHDWQALVSWFP